MAANNDFYLKFDSNASQWAKALEGQLAPARESVAAMKLALQQMEEQASKTALETRKVYTEQAGGQGRGSGTDPSSGVSTKGLTDQIHLQADAIQHVTEQLTLAMTALSAVPRKLTSTVKGIRESIARNAEIGSGRGKEFIPGQEGFVKTGTPGAIRTGSPEAQVLATVRAAVQRGGLGGGAVTGFGRTSTPGGITQIKRSDIDRANFDRVVTAIRAQTRVIASGIKVTGGVANVVHGPPTGPPTATPPPGAAAKTKTAPAAAAEPAAAVPLETRVDKIKADISETQRDIAEIITLLGKDLDEAGQQMVNTLKGTESKLKAQLASVEREEEGISQAEQKKRRRKAAEAARDARETITDVERQRRAGQAALVASPGASDFDTRASARARTAAGGNYSRDDLMRMAQAFRAVGIEVKANTNSTKQELIPRLKEAHAQYQQMYPTGAPQLATRDVNITKTAKISEATESILGDLNELIAQRTQARQLLRADKLGGGTGTVPKGRQGYGAGILGEEIGAPVVRAGTPAEVAAAEKVFQRRTQEQAAHVRDLATSRAFDPYAAEHRVEVPAGEGPEREKGLAAVARLADIRGATQQLDQFATRFYNLEEAIRQSGNFVSRATERLKKGRGFETDEANIMAARQQIAKNQAEMAGLTQRFGKLFTSSEFEAGYAQREGPAYGYMRPTDAEEEEARRRMGGPLTREQYMASSNRPIGSRAILEGRAEAYGPRQRTESDYRALMQSTASAVVGYRTAIGSRTQIRNIPGLGERGGMFYHTGQELSAEEQKKLNAATLKLAAAQTVHLHTINDAEATEEQVAKSFRKLENAANKLANRIQKGFGLAPTIETFMGQTGYGKEGVSDNFGGPGLSAKTQRDEARRQQARDEAADRAKQKITQTPEQAGVAVTGSRRRLAAAEKEKAATAEAVAKKEKEIADLVAQQSELDQAIYRSKQEELEAIRQGQKSLSNIALYTSEAPGYETGTQLKEAEARRAAAQARLQRATTTSGGLNVAQVQGSALAKLGATPDMVTKYVQPTMQKIQKAGDALAKAEQDVTKAEIDRAQAIHREQETVQKALGLISKAGGVVEGGPAPLEGVPAGAAASAAQERTRLARRERELRVQQAALLSGPGGQDLVGRLDELQKRRVGLQRTVGEAAAEGDLRENSGYQAAREELGRVRGEIQAIERQIQGGLIGALEKLKAEDQAAAGTVNTLTKELEKADKAAKKLGVTEKETTAAKVAATNGRLAELKAQRTAIKAEGPYTRGQRKEAFQRGGREDPEYIAIGERRKRLSKLNEEIKKLEEAAGGGGAGAGGGRTATGGARGGGDGNSILRQILAELKSLHTTVRGGVPVKPAAAGGAKMAVVPAAGEPAAAAPAPERRIRYLGDVPYVLPHKGEPSLAMDEAKRMAQDQLKGVVAPVQGDAAKQQAITQQRAAEAAKTTKKTSDAQTAAAKKEQRELAKTDAALQKQAQTKALLDTVTGSLSQETLHEVEVLRQLTQASKAATTAAEKQAAAEKIAAQQTRVAGAANRDLREQLLKGAQRRQGVQAVLQSAGPKVNQNDLNTIMKTAALHPEYRETFARAGEDSGEAYTDGFSRFLGGKGKGFFGRVMNTTGTFVVRNFAAGFVFGITNALQEVMDQAIKTEATFKRVSSALEATGKDTGSIRTDLSAISTDYGVQLNDVYETAAGLSGIFDNTKDLAAGTRIVAQLQTISGGALNAAEATGVLASTLSAFEALPGQDVTDKLLPGGIEGMQHVADVLTVIQNNMGVNIETSAEGMSRMAGQARQLQLSMEETAVFVSQIAKQTNLTGAGAGEQFSRILGSLQTGTGRGAVLEAYGAQSAVSAALSQGDYGQVVEQMIAGWDDLSDAQRRNVTTSVAGQRQAATFLGLMNGGQKTLNTLAKAKNADGEASMRMAELMDTLNKRLDVFRTQIQNLGSNLVRSHLLDFLGLVLVTTNFILDKVNDLFNLFNKFADETAFLGWLRTAIGLMLGAALAIKGIQVAAAGFRGALAESRIAQGASEGMAARRALRADQGLVAARPRYGEYQRAGTLTRLTSFGLDRSLGVGLDSASRQLTSWGGKLNVQSREIEGATRETTRFRRGLGQVFQGTGRLGGYVAGGLRDTLQGAERTRLSRDAFQQQQALYMNKAFDIRAAGGDEEEARRHDRMARASGAAGSSIGRLSNGMNSFAKSGALADTALLGVTLGLTSWITEMDRAGKSGENAKRGLKALIEAGQAAPGADQAEAVAPYSGPTSQAYQQRLEDMRNANWWTIGTQRMGAAIGAAGHGDPRSLLTLGLDSSSINKQLGIDPNSIYSGAGSQIGEFGGDTQAKMQKRGLELLQQHGDSVEGIAAAQKEFADETAKEAQKILDGDYSQSQQEALAAQLEEAGKFVTDTAANMAAMAQDMGQNMALTADQINRVSDTASLLASVGGQTTIGGVDMSAIYKELINQTGAEAGSDIQLILQRMASGMSDTADQFVLNRELLKREVKNAQANWIAKIADDPNSDEANEARAQLLQKIQDLNASTQAAIQGVIDGARLLSADLANTGQFDKSADEFSAGLDRAVDVYHQELAENQKTLDAIAKAQEIRTLLGDTIGALFGAFGGPPEEGGDLGGGLFGFGEQQPQGPAPRIGGRRQRRTGRPLAPPVAEGQAGDAADTQALVDKQPILQGIRDATQQYIDNQTAGLQRQAARTTDPVEKARIQKKIDRITKWAWNQINQGLGIPGVVSEDTAKEFGDATVTTDQSTQNDTRAIESNKAYHQSLHDQAEQAAQSASDIAMAQIGISSAYADAHGDTVRSAQLQVQVAHQAMALANQQMALAITPQEIAAAKIAQLNAQAQLISASAAVDAAQQDLVQSRYQVAIALAEAAGNTVLAATRTLEAARAALRAALKKSGGKATAEVNAARTQVIQTEAQLRDAELQDKLDTIDFNLQMGKITQSSAIAALREILRTSDLTKQQRRQLLLQIKGMKDEMADSQWNFGNIKLPTPYQMKAYITARRKQFRNELDQAAGGTSGALTNGSASAGGQVNNYQTSISINGADITEVKKVIRDVVGGSSSTITRTTGARRRR